MQTTTVATLDPGLHCEVLLHDKGSGAYRIQGPKNTGVFIFQDQNVERPPLNPKGLWLFSPVLHISVKWQVALLQHSLFTFTMDIVIGFSLQCLSNCGEERGQSH